MNENTIIKIALETIESGLEWGIGCKESHYAYYVEGVTTVTDALLEKLKEINKEKELKKATPSKPKKKKFFI